MTARWRNRRVYILVAALVVTFMAGAAVSTAYAIIGGDDVDAAQFNVTYAGVTDPVESLPDGIVSLVLPEVDGSFSEGQASQMTVDLVNTGFTGLTLLNSRECDAAGTSLGWCVQAGSREWVVMSQALLPSVLVDDSTLMWGPGYVVEIGGNGMRGLATYRVMLREPDDPSTDGMLVTINVDGFMNTVGGAISAPTFDLFVSASEDRSDPVELEGETISGDGYMFLLPEDGAETVIFLLDGKRHRRERNAPWDFAGDRNDRARAFDTTELADGAHNITAHVELSDDIGTLEISADFIVDNSVLP